MKGSNPKFVNKLLLNTSDIYGQTPFLISREWKIIFESLSSLKA